jgi:hypothetical protein
MRRRVVNRLWIGRKELQRREPNLWAGEAAGEARTLRLCEGGAGEDEGRTERQHEKKDLFQNQVPIRFAG